MPTDRKAAIRGALTDAHSRLVQVLDRVGPDEWSRASPNEGWTVRDLLVHLTTSETGFVATIRRMAAGEGGVPPDFDPNRWNASQLRRRAEQTPEQLRAEIDRSHAEMLQFLDSLDQPALDRRGHLSTGGEGSTEDNFLLVARHKQEHTNDIEAAIAPAARAGQ